MTKEQYATIVKLQQAYLDNIKEYEGWAAEDYCQFSTLKNDTNHQDDNITVMWNKITGISDSCIPETQIVNFLIDNNGTLYEMDMLQDVFKNRSEIVTYIQKLTKFDWNAK